MRQFVFLIPLATINYFPAHFILGRNEAVFGIRTNILF